MLGASAEGRALEIGAGGGAVSAVLASYCRQVVALDLDELAVRFMRHRFAQDGRENVHVVRADALRLPFAPGSFDLISLNGVLEWLPKAAPGVPPRQVQQEFLRQCAGILAPGGRICIGIENRWHFNYLRGRTPHGEVRFAPVLPRRLADWVSRRVRGAPYDTPIYSSRGLERLLRAAGFSRSAVYAALPTYDNPILVAPIESSDILHEMLVSSANLPRGGARRLVFLALCRLGLIKHLLHSFFVVGRKVA
jgi:SAM-dependent methyltransferase